MFSKQGLKELAKSFGRFIYFGVLGLIGLFLTDLATNPELLSSTVTLPVMGTLNLGALVALGIGFVVKAIDRYRHASEKNDSNGIAPRFLQS